MDHADFATWRTSRPPTEHAPRPAELAWLSSRPTRDALHPHAVGRLSLLCRHRARSVGAASKRRNQGFRFPRRSVPARIAPWRTSRPSTEHVACALKTWRGCHRCQRGARSTPPPLAEVALHRHRVMSAVAASKCLNQSFRIPWRPVHARFATWRTIRPATEHVRAGGLGVVVCAANLRRAPPPRR